MEMEREGHALHGRVVLHRLTLDERKAGLLDRSGIEVMRARSVREVCAAIDDSAQRVYVLVNLSTGSNAPERIYAHIAEARKRGEGERQFIACTTKRSPGAKRRASRLGLREVFVWPEGAFGELLRRLVMIPEITLHRLAERAAVQDGISGSSNVEFAGDLVNISASGALIECGLDHEELEGLTLELNVLGHVTVLDARVRWRERIRTSEGEERLRIGVEFAGVSRPARAAIDRFVRQANVIRVPTGRVASSASTPSTVRVRARRGRRADYFLLEGDLSSDATLVPRKAFFAPYQVGDALELDILSPRVMGSVRVEVVGRQVLDEGRVDSRIGWRVRLAPAPQTADTVEGSA